MTTEIVVTSEFDFLRFGCPHCGHRSGYGVMGDEVTRVFQCTNYGECGKTFCILVDGVTKSTIKFDGSFPEWQPHPKDHYPLPH